MSSLPSTVWWSRETRLEKKLSIARHLFGILRDFDELKVDRIYSEAFDTPRMGQAIMNRLMKAAGHQVISLGEKTHETV